MSSQVTCPVCSTRTMDDAMEASGMVLSLAEALVSRDNEQIKFVTENSTTYDFHMAVSLLIITLIQLADEMGIDFRELLASQRRQLNEAILNGGPGDPDSSDPS